MRMQRRATLMVRIAAYIDGFSVYHGLRSKGWKRYYWLDYRSLMETFVRPGETLVSATYFTSRVRKPEDSRRRQGLYLDALDAHGGLERVEGNYEHRPHKCPDCSFKWDRPKEKMTDVALASRLLMDAVDDVYDTALLMCADADLVPAVNLVRSRFERQVVVVVPRGRRSDELIKAADGSLHVPTSRLARCQLPDEVAGPARTFKRPVEWQ